MTREIKSNVSDREIEKKESKPLTVKPYVKRKIKKEEYCIEKIDEGLKIIIRL